MFMWLSFIQGRSQTCTTQGVGKFAHQPIDSYARSDIQPKGWLLQKSSSKTGVAQGNIREERNSGGCTGCTRGVKSMRTQSPYTALQEIQMIKRMRTQHPGKACQDIQDAAARRLPAGAGTTDLPQLESADSHRAIDITGHSKVDGLPSPTMKNMWYLDGSRQLYPSDLTVGGITRAATPQQHSPPRLCIHEMVSCRGRPFTW